MFSDLLGYYQVIGAPPGLLRLPPHSPKHPVARRRARSRTIRIPLKIQPTLLSATIGHARNAVITASNVTLTFHFLLSLNAHNTPKIRLSPGIKEETPTHGEIRKTPAAAPRLCHRRALPRRKSGAKGERT